MALTDKLSAIGEAIRAKTGKSDKLTLDQMPGEIASISGGGGGSAEGCVTVTFMNGNTELFSRPVYIGDDCPNPVDQKRIETPKKESTAQYNYTFYGWGASDGGAADANILNNITEDKTVYAIYTATVRTYTITYLDDDGSVLKTETLAYGAMPSYEPSKGNLMFNSWLPTLAVVTGNATYTAQWVEATLSAMSWQQISDVSAAGTGANYFAVGDSKAIHVQGTVGTLSLDQTFYVFILGFNHNSTREGNGIHFSCFRTYVDGVSRDLCLIDNKYMSQSADGTKYFNMSHWGASNYGGWAGCDLRYDILGSTDVAPSDYGAAPTSGRVGYDATSTCATNPIENTLMSCLPADLRAVMKPITKWSQNSGYDASENATITASVDYLPLLSVYEEQGTAYNNHLESDYQSQYQYYKDGNSYRRYKQTDLAATSSSPTWTRTATLKGTNSYYYGQLYSSVASTSQGIAPVFMV